MKLSIVLISLFCFMSSYVECSRPVSITCGDDYDETERGPAGPAGKRGPKGSSGQKGEQGAKGDKGQSDESQAAIARLQGRILDLENEVESKIDTAVRLGQRGNCNDVLKQGYDDNGLYNITVGRRIHEVYCDFTTDRGSWLTFQRRVDGELSFFKTWSEYKEGFGQASGEFWLGLDSLYLLTNSGSYSLRVDMKDWEGNTAHAEYSTFLVGNEASNYRLTVGGFSGNAGEVFRQNHFTRAQRTVHVAFLDRGDSLAYHNGGAFSTRDNDNDEYPGGSCSQEHFGGWWYKICHYSNLNGKYYRGGSSLSTGVDWRTWKNTHYSLKHVEMKIRHN